MVDVRSSVVWTIAETVATLLASLSMLLVVARIIGPKEFGLASIVFFVGSLAESIISLSFTEPLIQKQNLTSRMTNTAFTLMVIGSFAVYALLIISAPAIGLIYDEPMITKLIAIQGLTCLCLGVRGVPEAILARSMQFRALAMRGIAAKTIGALAAIASAFAGAGAWSVILGNLMYSVTAAAFVWIVKTQSFRMMIDKKDAQEIYMFGRYSFADAILTTASARIYGLLIAYFYDVRTFGEISVAFRFNDTIVSILAQTVNRIALPIMSGVSGDYNIVLINWQIGTRIMMLIAIPTMLGMAAVGPDLIEAMLGASWKGASPALTAVSIYSAFNLSAVLVSPALKSIGKPSKLLAIHAYSISFLIISTLISSLWGVYATLMAYGMLGFVYCLGAMLVLQSALKLNPLREIGFSCAKIWILATVMGLSINYTRIRLDNMFLPYRLFLLVVGGVTIYAILTATINRGALADLLRKRKNGSGKIL
jgi:O-antigen/teichoic acid export membrane protein